MLTPLSAAPKFRDAGKIFFGDMPFLERKCCVKIMPRWCKQSRIPPAKTRRASSWPRRCLREEGPRLFTQLLKLSSWLNLYRFLNRSQSSFPKVGGFYLYRWHPFEGSLPCRSPPFAPPSFCRPPPFMMDSPPPTCVSAFVCACVHFSLHLSVPHNF